jgi:hypothetical protein
MFQVKALCQFFVPMSVVLHHRIQDSQLLAHTGYLDPFTTPDHLAQLYKNPTIFHRQIYGRVEKKSGVLGGKKLQ